MFNHSFAREHCAHIQADRERTKQNFFEKKKLALLQQISFGIPSNLVFGPKIHTDIHIHTYVFDVTVVVAFAFPSTAFRISCANKNKTSKKQPKEVCLKSIAFAKYSLPEDGNDSVTTFCSVD